MGWKALTIALAVSAGCSDSTEPPDPNEVFDPFVGTWDATHFTVTSDADTTLVANLLEDGSFTINIQPSGQYTATLVLGQLPQFVEFGQLDVNGGTLRLVPDRQPDPCPASSQFQFSGADAFSLTGPTCFDFNLDGTDEAAQAEIQLVRH